LLARGARHRERRHRERGVRGREIHRSRRESAQDYRNHRIYFLYRSKQNNGTKRNIY
jgi:hypothetical protein